MSRYINNIGFGIPAAIIAAGVLITIAILFSGGGGSSISDSSDTNQEAGIRKSTNSNFRMPSSLDHIRGNPEASVAIVEFSDFECPFCARLHPSLSRVVTENEDVSWVYRHFPLSSIHFSALSAAVASECIAKLGGNDAFWSFTDRAFANQRNLGTSFYEDTVTSLGIDLDEFRSCGSDKSIAAEVSADLKEVTSLGGRGTPFAVIVTPTGNLMPFSGALSYNQVLGLIEQARNN